MEGFANAVTSIAREVLQTVLPSWCVACDGNLPWRDRVGSCCGRCWASLPKINSARCTSCALPIPGTGDVCCLKCQLDPLPVEWSDAWGHYTGSLESVLRAFKFGRHDFLAAPLGDLAVERLTERGDLQFDAVVPVPMSWRRERARGYNQAELLARAVSSRARIACRPRWLSKPRERQAQSRLARRDRAANVRTAFSASRDVAGSAILLVDDICTTGETLRACARTLVRAGAERVCAITIAKAS